MKRKGVTSYNTIIEDNTVEKKKTTYLPPSQRTNIDLPKTFDEAFPTLGVKPTQTKPVAWGKKPVTVIESTEVVQSSRLKVVDDDTLMRCRDIKNNDKVPSYANYLRYKSICKANKIRSKRLYDSSSSEDDPCKYIMPEEQSDDNDGSEDLEDDNEAYDADQFNRHK